VPELPEVETTRRDLADRISGRTVTGVCFVAGGVSPARELGPDEFTDALVGRRIERLTRRGKYLVMHFADGGVLVLHRRMSGNLLLREPGATLDPYTRATISLDDGRELRWTDLRRFGTWRLADTPEQAIPQMGPEPLEDAWRADDLAAALKDRRAPVKAALLDQRRVAGLGNIYADESLHLARIHPRRPAGSLAPDELQRLHQAIRAVLNRALDLRGSTSSTYMDGMGERGTMQDEWRVYHRTGAPCAECGTLITRLVVAGRGTHICLKCQPPPGGTDERA